MSRIFELDDPFGPKFGQATVIVPRELCLGEHQVQLRQDVCRLLQLSRTLAKTIGQLRQQPSDFRRFLLLQLHSFIVEPYGLHRLDENAGAARARPVDDARNAPLPAALYRDHETVIVNRDDLILKGRILPPRFQKTLQRLLNLFPHAFDLLADSFQLRACGGRNGAVGKNLLFDLSHERPEIGQ